MDNKINGRTLDEIKRGVRCLARGKYPNAYCNGCSYFARATEHLSECKTQEIIKDVDALTMCVEMKFALYKFERDAAIKDDEPAYWKPGRSCITGGVRITPTFICSKCEGKSLEFSNYCPNCGKSMRKNGGPEKHDVN